MKRVVVTGGSGKAGRAVIAELLRHGYQVMNVDTVAPQEQLCHFMKTDLNDLGQAIDALMSNNFPNVPVGAKLGEFDTLLSIDKARRVLGYAPQYTWRN